MKLSDYILLLPSPRVKIAKVLKQTETPADGFHLSLAIRRQTPSSVRTIKYINPTENSLSITV